MNISYRKYHAGWLAGLSLALGAICLPSSAAPSEILNAKTVAPSLSSALPVTNVASDSDQMPDVTSSSYILAPTDNLDISVLNQPDLHQASVPILADGSFTFPVIGNVKAAGLTVAQVTSVLTKGLSGRYNHPQVTVVVLTSHTRKISVTGAVRAPGLYDYHPALRLLEVISESGGPLQAPEQTQVNVISDSGNKNTPIDLVKLMAGDSAQNIILSPGDGVLFSPMDQAKSMIQITGEVQHPGYYGVVSAGATVISMITLAGGPTPLAALTKVQINHAGQVRMVNLHPTKYDLDDPSGKTMLVAGDQLLVPTNNAKYAVLGEVRQPTEYLFPDGEDITLTQAIAVAGGPTSEGDQQHLGILRHDPKDMHSDKRIFIEVNMKDMLANKNSVADPSVEPGDILVIPTRHHPQGLMGILSNVTSVAYNAALLGTRL